MNVADTLIQDILLGKYPVGAHFPAERQLAAQLGVSRPALREALRRLESLGLVTSHHGSGTLVEDWRRTARLDLLPYFISAGAPDVDAERLIREMLNLRVIPLAEVVRMAATYGSPNTADHALAGLKAAWSLRDKSVEFALADFQIYRQLAADAEFPPVAWLLNSAMDPYRLFLERMPGLVIAPADYPVRMRGIIAAIRDREPSLAVARLRDYFTRLDRATGRKLGLKEAA
jgi:GntR family transcriptional regulator, transcriptional repressor for pyruvate dehydrogenase complex